MYVVNNASNIQYTIATTEQNIVGNDWDISIEDPTGHYLYYNDSLINSINPTETETGLVTFTFTPTMAGVHTISLSRGSASNHQIINKKLLSVVDVTLLTNINVSL